MIGADTVKSDVMESLRASVAKQPSVSAFIHHYEVNEKTAVALHHIHPRRAQEVLLVLPRRPWNRWSSPLYKDPRHFTFNLHHSLLPNPLLKIIWTYFLIACI